MSENGTANGGDHSRNNHNQHDARYHLVYAFGYAALSLAVDFIFIWPESHLFALLFLAAAFSLLALYELRNIPSDWSIIVPGILFMAALTAYVIVGPVPPTETETHGWLTPAKEPLPADNACMAGGDIQQIRPDGMLFSLGKAGMSRRSNPCSFPKSAFRLYVSRRLDQRRSNYTSTILVGFGTGPDGILIKRFVLPHRKYARDMRSQEIHEICGLAH
jgi:hypothetical protein